MCQEGESRERKNNHFQTLNLPKSNLQCICMVEMYYINSSYRKSFAGCLEVITKVCRKNVKLWNFIKITLKCDQEKLFGSPWSLQRWQELRVSSFCKPLLSTHYLPSRVAINCWLRHKPITPCSLAISHKYQVWTQWR